MVTRIFDKISFSPEVHPIEHMQNNTITLHVQHPNTLEEPIQSAEVYTCSARGIVDISDPNPKRRIRGLQSLEKSGITDLFDWCVLYLEDESVDVVCSALRIMSRCDEGYVSPILPYAESKNKRIRAGALAALAKHASDDSERWFERALKDPAACVRIEVAKLLPMLDKIERRTLFDIAQHDPNPAVKRSARRRH